MHAGDPTGGVPGEVEGEQRHQTYQAKMFSWLQKIYKWQSWIHLFDYVAFKFLPKWHIVEETFVAQKKCAYYQSGAQFSIKTLSSTNI